MNKKFFAALASATMAFTASGSIAVFADDFVEEKTPVVDNGDVTPTPETVKWNQDNFGALATKEGAVDNTNVSFTGTITVKDGYVKTKELENVTSITLNAGFNGEVKGLEYFTGLTTFSAESGTLTNKTLDFAANTKLGTLKVTKAANLTGITLPESYKNDDDEDVYALKYLTLDGTKLTSLDLSAQEGLTEIIVRENKNLSEIKLREATQKNPVTLTTLALRDNALETIDLDRYVIEENLNLSGNHIGALDLSKTTVKKTIRLGGEDTPGNLAQTFYVSQTLENVNLAETFANFDKEAVVVTGKNYDEKTGVLTLTGDETVYEYKTGKGNLRVKLTKANPMNRLYNPNSGEHFYTADLEEKAALVNLGWNDEGYGWVAPKEGTGTKVYRLYNPNAGDHHYTTDPKEKDTLVTYGWKDENVGWYSDGKVAVYRQYNPYANGAGSHNYTTDKAENDYLVSLGWTPEGTAWFALQ